MLPCILNFSYFIISYYLLPISDFSKLNSRPTYRKFLFHLLTLYAFIKLLFVTNKARQITFS
jgi:hypothetical protein